MAKRVSNMNITNFIYQLINVTGFIINISIMNQFNNDICEQQKNNSRN